jgi:hypothetical protein
MALPVVRRGPGRVVGTGAQIVVQPVEFVLASVCDVLSPSSD